MIIRTEMSLRARARSNFEAKEDNQINLVRGQEYTVTRHGNAGEWSYGEDKTGDTSRYML